MKSIFAKQDTTLIVDGEKLFINKAELIEKSPVFEKMFTVDFKEKNAHEIELPGKNLQHFWKFLRCTLDGYQDDITGKFQNITNYFELNALSGDKLIQVPYTFNALQILINANIINIVYHIL